MKWCIYNPVKEKFYIGATQKEVINKLCKIRLDNNRKLFVKCEGYPEYSYHSYTDEFTDEEMHNNIINFLIHKIQTDYQCVVFKNIN